MILGKSHTGLRLPTQEVHPLVVLQLQGPAPHAGLGCMHVLHPGGQAPALQMFQAGTGAKSSL